MGRWDDNIACFAQVYYMNTVIFGLAKSDDITVPPSHKQYRSTDVVKKILHINDVLFLRKADENEAMFIPRNSLFFDALRFQEVL